MAGILILAGDGTASDHLDYAYFRMLEEGFEVTIAAPEKRPIKTAIHMGSPGDYVYTIERAGYDVPVQSSFDDADPRQFDGLLLITVAAPIKKRLDTVIDMREEGWDMKEVAGKYNFENLGFWIPAHATFDEVDPSKFAGLLLPGWRGAEYLRHFKTCIDAIRHFVDSGSRLHPSAKPLSC